MKLAIIFSRYRPNFISNRILAHLLLALSLYFLILPCPAPVQALTLNLHTRDLYLSHSPSPPESSLWSNWKSKVKLQCAYEYDSNALRIQDSEGAKPDWLTRFLLRSWFNWQGNKKRLSLHPAVGGKKFISLSEADLFILDFNARYLQGLNKNHQLTAWLETSKNISRQVPEKYWYVQTSIGDIYSASSHFDLIPSLGSIYFRYDPNYKYDFIGTFLGVRLNYKPWGPSFAASSGYTFEWRQYKGDKKELDVLQDSEGQSLFGEITRTNNFNEEYEVKGILRHDYVHTFRGGLTARSGSPFFFIGHLNYYYRITDSNSYGSSLKRHSIILNFSSLVVDKIFFHLRAGFRHTDQIKLPGYYSPAADVKNYDENRNFFLVKISREIYSGLGLEVGGGYFFNQMSSVEKFTRWTASAGLWYKPVMPEN